MIRGALFVAGLLLAAAGALWALEIPVSTGVTFRDCQPDSIDYKSYGPYCGGLVEKQLIGSRRCELRIVKKVDSLTDGYGYSHSLTGLLTGCPANPALKWAESGATLEFQGPLGPAHIAVPRSAFVGGR